MLQRLELMREQKAKNWREIRENDRKLERDGKLQPVEFRQWLGGERKDGVVIKVNTADLSPAELEQLIDIMSRDGATDLARRLREENAANRVPAKTIESDFTRFRKGLDDLTADASDSREVGELTNLCLDLGQLADALLKTLESGAIVNAAQSGGIEGLRNRMVPTLVFGRGAVLRCALAIRLQGVAPALAKLREDLVVATPEVTENLLSGVRQFRASQAYAPVTGGSQWQKGGVAEVLPPEHAKEPDPQAVAALSKRNLKLLQEATAPLFTGKDAERWTRLYERLKALRYRIKHATPAFRAIANAGAIASLGGLVRRGAKHKASGMSSSHNTTALGNADFVFFRFEVGDKPMATRYGPTTMIFDPALLVKLGGWVSLHDQLAPLDRPTTRQVTDPKTAKAVRTTEYPPGQTKTGERAKWIHTYATTGEQVPTSFLEEVFYGEDIIQGLALSIVREVHRIGGGFADDLLGLGPDAPAEQVDQRVSELVKGLVRPEAKIPASIPVESATVIDPSGDGRYYPDGTIHPEGTFAAMAADAAADIRQQIVSFVDGYERAETQHGPSSPQAEKERNKVVGRWNELLAQADRSLEQTEKFVTVAAREAVRSKEANPDAVEQLDTATRVLERRRKLRVTWQNEAKKWLTPSPTPSASETGEKAEQPAKPVEKGRGARRPVLKLERGIDPSVVTITSDDLAAVGTIGKSDGTNNLCLLNTLAQFTGGQTTGVQLQQGLLNTVRAFGAAGTAAHQRLTTNETLDVYGAEGAIVLEHVMAQFNFRIQIVQDIGGQLLVHPVLGVSGPIRTIHHSAEHFVPVHPKNQS